MQWAQAKLRTLGADVELCDIGQQVFIKYLQFNIFKKELVSNNKQSTRISKYS